MIYGVGGGAYFWQDTFRTDNGVCVVYYDNGYLVPTVYLSGGVRLYPGRVLASLFTGPDAQSERDWQMGLISAALGSAASSAKEGRVDDPTFQKQYPTLYAFMTVVEEDGKKRTPSSLVFFAEGAEFKACLTERDANLQLWRTGETLQKLLASLEKALTSGNADWRRKFDPGANGGGRRGKK